MDKPIISVISVQNELSEKMCIPTIHNGWYLHGVLEDRLGYDIANCYEISDECPCVDENINGYVLKALRIEGIYPVKVYGIDEECIGYFWLQKMGNDIIQRGLVVLASDEEGWKDAEKKYKEKPIIF